MNNSSFTIKTATPKALVRFWLERPSHKAIGQHALKTYITTLFGDDAKNVLKRGYFLVDDVEAAHQCVAILEAVRDIRVGQFVFGASAYALV